MTMSSQPEPFEQLSGVNPEHIGLLDATLRAPSAHNAQPWLIRPLDDNRTYELHYDQNETLPEDRDSKDAYLTMGALVETMALQAPNHGFDVAVTPQLTRDGQDLFIAKVAITGLTEDSPFDILSNWVDKRVTNRNRYQKDPLPAALEHDLEGLGNVLVDPELLKDVVLEASIKSWANPRYLRDLETWFRNDEAAEDGITPRPFNISKADVLALRFAFWRGSLKSKMMGQFYSSRDVGTFTSGPKAAVLTAAEMTPPALFDAGRRLLRSWVTITAADYSYQPFSVAVDEESAAAKVGEITGVEFPVALYRIGRAAKPPRGLSNRKPLHKVLIKG